MDEDWTDLPGCTIEKVRGDLNIGEHVFVPSGHYHVIVESTGESFCLSQASLNAINEGMVEVLSAEEEVLPAEPSPLEDVSVSEKVDEETRETEDVPGNDGDITSLPGKG